MAGELELIKGATVEEESACMQILNLIGQTYVRKSASEIQHLA